MTVKLPADKITDLQGKLLTASKKWGKYFGYEYVTSKNLGSTMVGVEAT